MRPPKLPGTEKFRFSQLPSCEPRPSDPRDHRKVKLPITSRLIRVLALTDLTLENIKDYIKCIPLEGHFVHNDSYSSLPTSLSSESNEYQSNSPTFSFPIVPYYTMLYTVPSKDVNT